MVGFTQIGPASESQPAIYLGLSATAMSHKNSGIVRTLFRRFTSDARAYQADAGRPVVMFGTALNPKAANLFVDALRASLRGATLTLC